MSRLTNDEQNINSNVNLRTLSYQQVQHGWTNTVLINAEDNRKTFYIPTYMRTKMTNIVSIDISKMIGELNLIIYTTFYYGDLKQSYPKVYEVLEDQVVLRFKMDTSVRLQAGFSQYEQVDLTGKRQQHSYYIKKTLNTEQKLMSFMFRKTIKVPLNCFVFFSPFQYIEYPITIFIQTIKIVDHEADEKYAICFNLMDLTNPKERNLVASYANEGLLGEYDLTEAKIRAQFSNRRFRFDDNSVLNQVKNKKDLDIYDLRFDNEDTQNLVSYQKVVSYQYGHFVYPVYRRPMVPLFAIFFPMIMLGFLNLGVFFQNQRTGKRLLNISAIMVSYIAFLPRLREHLPPASNLVISEMLMFLMASLTILALIDTIDIRDYMLRGEQYKINWEENGLFIAALVCTLVIAFVLVVISLVYLLYVNRKFNIQEQPKRKVFRKQDWSHEQCDKYFQHLKLRDFHVQPLSSYNMRNPSYFYKIQKQALSKAQTVMSFIFSSGKDKNQSKKNQQNQKASNRKLKAESGFIRDAVQDQIVEFI